MALGPLTYKTPNQITNITADLTDKEGRGVTLTAQGTIGLATSQSSLPYGLIIVGAASVNGTYTGPVAAGALEIVDAIGAVVQVGAGGTIAVGDALQVDGNAAFIAAAGTVGEYVWGYALTAASSGQQFLMRFQPFIKQV
jgi:hypothetical protein